MDTGPPTPEPPAPRRVLRYRRRSPEPSGARQTDILIALQVLPFISFSGAAFSSGFAVLLPPVLFVAAGLAFLVAGGGGRRRRPALLLVGILDFALAVASVVLIVRMSAGYQFLLPGV